MDFSPNVEGFAIVAISLLQLWGTGGLRGYTLLQTECNDVEIAGFLTGYVELIYDELKAS